MNDAMLGYIAGLFDGEGSVYLNKQNKLDTLVKVNQHTTF